VDRATRRISAGPPMRNVTCLRRSSASRTSRHRARKTSASFAVWVATDALPGLANVRRDGLRGREEAVRGAGCAVAVRCGAMADPQRLDQTVGDLPDVPGAEGQDEVPRAQPRARIVH